MMEEQEKLDQLLSWKMVQFIKVNGLLMKIKKMDVVYKFGQMVQDMMVSGEMEWLMDMAV